MDVSKVSKFATRAREAGFRRVWVLSRDAVENAFAPSDVHTSTQPPALPPPSTFHPGYTRALLLASPGRWLWEHLQAESDRVPDPADDPLDRFTELSVEALANGLRKHDPTLVTTYPFRHERQLLGFPRLTAGIPWSSPAPLGILVDPVHGPWFAWRALLLTRLDLPVTPLPDPSPCVECIAASPAGRSPCIATCPAKAVKAPGFDWESCAKHRLENAPCQSACPARLACPVGAGERYGPEQLHHHYTASLRVIRRWKDSKNS